MSTKQAPSALVYQISSADLTSSAPLTDSSQRSIINSSNAIDSLSTLMRRWHSLGTSGQQCPARRAANKTHCGRKNSISSYANCRSFVQST